MLHIMKYDTKVSQAETENNIGGVSIYWSVFPYP